MHHDNFAFMASLGYSGMEPQRVVDSLAALGYGDARPR